MINRILIRIKVVQMLYSYMLTRSEFRILPPPEKKNRDARCAYNIYFDLLLLILKLSGQNVNTNGVSNPLARLGVGNVFTTSKVAKSLAADSDIRDMILKRTDGIDHYNSVLEGLYDRIASSEVYKDFAKKRKRDIEIETRTWVVILRNIVARDEKFMEVARNNEDFTAKGFAEGLEMTVNTLEDYSDNKLRLANYLRSLEVSLDKAYELYHALLLLPGAITRLQAERIAMGKEKYIPTDSDLNPSTRLVDNRLIHAIEANEDMQAYLKSTPISWDGEFYAVKALLDKILASDIYAKYLALEETDMAADCEFWRQVMKFIVIPSNELAEVLENKSVYWNDDLHIMGTFAIKTIKQFSTADDVYDLKLLPEYKDDEDARFGPELFTAAVANADNYKTYIDRFINPEQWDTDRIAFMDIVILIASIAELISFPAIPVPVTMNEYVEIANYYSTPRSGQFVNGMLFAIAKYLHDEGVLNKDVTAEKQ